MTLVVPDSNNIIDSVTSSSICTIAQELLNYNVEKRQIPYSELSPFSEVIAAGTAAGLAPIRTITMKSRDEKLRFRCGPRWGGRWDNLCAVAAGIAGDSDGES